MERKIDHFKRWNILVTNFGDLLRKGVKIEEARASTIGTYKSRGHGKNKPFTKSWSVSKITGRSKYNKENTKGKR